MGLFICTKNGGIMASITKADSRKWRAIVWIDGKRKTKQGFRTKREAEQWSYELKAGVSNDSKINMMICCYLIILKTGLILTKMIWKVPRFTSIKTRSTILKNIYHILY